jgi:hypothetical protein
MPATSASGTMHAYRFVPGFDKLQKQDLPVPVPKDDEGKQYFEEK